MNNHITTGINGTVYALRVWRKSDGAKVAIYGAEAKDVVSQDETVYAKYDHEHYMIERKVLPRISFEGYPEYSDEMTAQEFAHFALG